MWFIGVEVEQETSAPLLKKSWIRPCVQVTKSLLSFSVLWFGIKSIFPKNFFDSWYMVHFACILSLTKISLFCLVNFDDMSFM